MSADLGTGSASRDGTRLAALLADVSAELLASQDGSLTFDRVAARAVEVVPGIDHASLTLRSRQRAETVGTSDEVAEQCDRAQYSLGEGPALHATFSEPSCLVRDLGSEDRFSRWSPVPRRLGVCAALSIRLHTRAESLGSLNLYASRPDTFDQDTVDIALIYASHAAQALTRSRLVTDLHSALESRHLIGLAQGILAVRYDVSYEAAFEVLRRYSNDTNTKLRDLAQVVADTRRLPSD